MEIGGEVADDVERRPYLKHLFQGRAKTEYNRSIMKRMNFDASQDHLNLSSLDKDVRIAQMQLSYDQLPSIIAGSLAGALFLGFFLVDIVPGFRLIIWLVLVLIGLGIFPFLLYIFQKHANSERRSARFWRLAMMTMACFGGCVWGSAGFLLFVPSVIEYQFILIFFMFMGVASTMTFTAAYTPYFYASTIPMLLPVSIRVGLVPDPTHLGMALMAPVFFCVMFYAHRNINSTVTEALKLRFKNMDLVRDLTVQKERAEQANQAKSRFLAAASHDLRQPLHAQGLFLAELDERLSNSEDRVVLEKLETTVIRMRDLFDSLLDISKLDAGIIEKDIEPIRVNVLFERIKDEFMNQAEIKGLKLSVISTNSVVTSDFVLLTRILNNLVDNAIKYTQTGSVLIGCRRQGAKVRIEVRDSGLGIPNSQQQLIFQEFQQLDNPERDHNLGLGLGLAIVTRLANFLDHRVLIHSELGRGSVFSVILDRGKQVSDTDVASSHRPLYQDLSGYRVVVIDDDESILDGMQRLLQAWKCDVIIASTLIQVMDRFETWQQEPDVIIADYRLAEGQTGTQVTREIQARYNVRIPVILITGDTAPELLNEVKDSGHYLLHKPVAPEKLRTLLNFLSSKKFTGTR